MHTLWELRFHPGSEARSKNYSSEFTHICASFFNIQFYHSSVQKDKAADKNPDSGPGCCLQREQAQRRSRAAVWFELRDVTLWHP
jgi:hypothetical protein